MSMPTGQVRDSLSKDSTDTAHMSLQNDTVTGTHAHTYLPPIIVQRKFQATVEEYGSDTSSVVSVVSPMEKCSSHSRTSTASRAYSETQTPPSSRGCSPRHGHKPSVHFSTRHPVVLHHRTGSSSSSSREGSCRGADSTTTATTTTTGTGGGTPFLSAVDKQWGILFSEHGEPTKRLGQALRGLANYMIREYEPRSSLVIPPGKLYALYRRHRLEKEPFPLGAIFDMRSRHALRSLELLYQDLSCEYHLIQDQDQNHQDHHRTRPSIPALTPAGLQTWLTSFIQASPDTESLRLSGILLDAPLEADTSLSPHGGGPGAEPEPEPEPEPERLPAQLPRYLLPARRNERAHREVVAALHDWHRRMGIASEPPSPSSSSSSPPPPRRSTLILHDDAPGAGTGVGGPSSTSTTWSPPRSRELKKTCLAEPPPKRLAPRRSTEPTANTGRPRLRQRERFTRPEHPPEERRASRKPDRESRGPRDLSPPEGWRRPRASRRDPSPKAGAGAGPRDAPPGRDEACITNRRQVSLRHAIIRDAADEGAASSTPPDRSPARAESYRFFQGRGLGPTYDEFWRERGRMSV